MSDCRFCKAPLKATLVDLGLSPLSNNYPRVEDLDKGEEFFPLQAKVCERCWLVQLDHTADPSKIFSDYAYFSSLSGSWLMHAKKYCEWMKEKLSLGASNLVVEIASNDGYLLQHFKQYAIPILGIEPAKNVAQVAIDKGVPTVVDFFNLKLAEKINNEYGPATLIIANNVFAHVPNINSFVSGLKKLLANNGWVTLEFPHLLELIRNHEFDTIYHEHFFYFSLHAVQTIFSTHELVVFDVERLSTHGGSLRIYVSHANEKAGISDRMQTVLQDEIDFGLLKVETYLGFSERVKETKRELLDFLIGVKKKKRTVVAYGAPAKGNTLLNYCGIRTDFIDYTVDRNEYKQSRYLPGTRIPIYHPTLIERTRPDFVLILPWNIQNEITEQLAFIKDWGGQFVIPIPKVKIIQ